MHVVEVVGIAGGGVLEIPLVSGELHLLLIGLAEAGGLLAEGVEGVEGDLGGGGASDLADRAEVVEVEVAGSLGGDRGEQLVAAIDVVAVDGPSGVGRYSRSTLPPRSRMAQ
jgi:hypothetical protein